ncbi:MAG: HepT-like ribonuclease domain-containing protein [Phycisphaerales bacterium]
MPRRGRDARFDDQTRLRHMLEAARQAISFLPGRSRVDLDTDHMLRRALKDCIPEIGEAAYHVTDEGRASVPDLPWEKMVGMRHILVHAYFELDNDAIWKVASTELEVLRDTLIEAMGDADQ